MKISLLKISIELLGSCVESSGELVVVISWDVFHSKTVARFYKFLFFYKYITSHPQQNKKLGHLL